MQRLLLSIFLLLALALPSDAQRAPDNQVLAISRAPVAVAAGNLTALSVDPDNGALDTVLCDQNGVTCVDVGGIPADNAGFGGYLTVTGSMALFDGSTYDRMRSNSATTASATTQEFATQVAGPGEWTVVSTVTGVAVSSASKASGGGTVRHVARSVTACMADTDTAEARSVSLRDGATGAGTILWTALLTTATTTASCVTLGNLNIIGSAATAMTLEFSGNGTANSTQTATLTGYSTQ